MIVNSDKFQAIILDKKKTDLKLLAPNPQIS